MTVFVSLIILSSLLYALYTIYVRIFALLWPYFLAQWLGRNIKPRSLGRWAVVTGATDGIGLAFAKELARQGMNVFLVGRSAEKLATVQDSISNSFPAVTVDVHRIDLSTYSLEEFSVLSDRLATIEVGLLINNAAMSYFPEYFCEIPNAESTIKDLIGVNCHALSQVSHCVISQMISRGRGAIVNVSSMSAVHACPLLSLYAASKAFVQHFSNCLRLEVADKGIIVQCLYTFGVATKMSGIKKESWWAASPESYAREALSTLGTIYQTTGCRKHAVQDFCLSFVPKFILEVRFLKHFRSVRDRAVAKRKRHF